MKTKIDYLDAVWNPIVGCSKVSEGCKNCYAEKMANRLSRIPATAEVYSNVITDGKWSGRVYTNSDKLFYTKFPKKPSIIGVNFMSDTFHENVSDIWLDNLFTTIYTKGKQHQFLILTKRPERMLDYLDEMQADRTYIYPFLELNIWFGVSVENQKTADERIPILLKLKEISPNVKVWVSVEPMLGEVDLSKWISQIDWVVAGSESGMNKRHGSTSCFTLLKWNCEENNVPLFIKQVNVAGMLIKDINQFPEEFRIQQFPEGME